MYDIYISWDIAKDLKNSNETELYRSQTENLNKCFRLK